MAQVYFKMTLLGFVMLQEIVEEWFMRDIICTYGWATREFRS